MRIQVLPRYFHKRDRVFQRAFNEVALSFARGEEGETERDTTESQGALFLRSCRRRVAVRRPKRKGREGEKGECEV